MAESSWVIAGRYRVLGRIGAGGMADVLRAQDQLLDRVVAVKVFRSLPVTPDTAVGVERQQAELRALAQLNHPNLVVLYDGSIVNQDGPAYLVMELVEGESLAEAIAAGGLGTQRTAEVAAQVADALAYVHAAGMVHRDVKPANILLGRDAIAAADWGRARLTDFGIVRLIGDDSSLTRPDMTLGSASYLAPEQARGSAVGPPADVYALGLSLLEALTGRRSFDGPPLEAAVARLSRDPDIPADLPNPWPGLLRAMTARDPAARPSAAQVAQALRGSDSATEALVAVPVPPSAGGPGAADTRSTTAFIPRGQPTPTRVGPPPSSNPPRPAGPPPPVRVDRGLAAAPVPDPDGSPRLRGWLIAAGVLVAILIVGGILIAVTSGGGGGGGDAPSTKAPSTRTTPSATPTTSRSSAPRTDTSPPASDTAAPTDTGQPSDSAPPSDSAVPSDTAPPTQPSSQVTTSQPSTTTSGPTGSRTTAGRSNGAAPPAQASGVSTSSSSDASGPVTDVAASP